MRNVSIIGAGQSGLMVASGLLDAGYEVTLYSDRSAEELRHATVPSSAGISLDAQSAEAELELNHWDDEVETLEGVHFDVVAPDGSIPITVEGPWDANRQEWRCVDLRLKCSRWLGDFEARGGRVVVKEATLEDLEACADASDLTIVATGKGELSSVFERDAERSMLDRPLRHISMIIVKGHPGWADLVGFRPLYFRNFVGRGEIFGGTFLNTTEEPTIFLIFEGVPGGPIDRFGEIDSNEEQLEVSKQIIGELAPWEYERVEGMTLADPSAAIRGRIAPTVRKPVLRLPSGRVALGMGDTLALKDPIGGQGANSAAKGAKHYLERIRERGDRPFDAGWMQETFDSFWEEYEQYADAFNNGLMQPLQDFQQELFAAAADRPDLAAKVFGCFSHPPSAFPWLVDPEEARKVIEGVAA